MWNQWCTLPDLPVDRVETHTQEGLLTCGGTECHKWNNVTGTWDLSHNLTSGRENRLSWTPASGNGTYLIGGYWDQGEWEGRPWDHVKTQVLLRPNGTVEQFNFTGGARSTTGAQ